MACTRNAKKCKREGQDLLPRCCYRALRNTLFFTTQLLEDNNIDYWVDFGTLLGAFRHEDIIPWDTDCDIGILAKDKDKLISLSGFINKKGFKYHDYYPSLKSISWSKTNLNIVDIYLWNVAPATSHKLAAQQNITGTRPIIINPLGGFQTDNTSDMPYWFVRETEECVIAGRKMRCPRRPRQFLRFRYGEWRNPFHWNSPNYYHTGKCKGCYGNVLPLIDSLNYVEREQ